MHVAVALPAWRHIAVVKEKSAFRFAFGRRFRYPVLIELLLGREVTCIGVEICSFCPMRFRLDIRGLIGLETVSLPCVASKILTSDNDGATMSVCGSAL
jgi:hypothetical protein